MSTHYVSKYKYSHDKRRDFFFNMVKNGKAEIINTSKTGTLIKTTNGVNYRVSNKGNVVRVDK